MSTIAPNAHSYMIKAGARPNDTRSAMLSY